MIHRIQTILKKIKSNLICFLVGHKRGHRDIKSLNEEEIPLMSISLSLIPGYYPNLFQDQLTLWNKEIDNDLKTTALYSVHFCTRCLNLYGVDPNLKFNNEQKQV